MRLIESKAELLKQGEGLQGIYQMIELAGRTCYKSEDKITDSSSVDFVKRMITSGHTAMLEHGTVYLYLEVTPENSSTREESPSGLFSSPYTWREIVSQVVAKYNANPYSRVVTRQDGDIERNYITTNYRVLLENVLADDLKYICEPTEYHERRISLKFTTDRGVSHELVRHRVFSFAQESTRYCNYSKDKFGNELTFIIPFWANIGEGNYYKGEMDSFYVWMVNGEYLNTQTEHQSVELFLNSLKWAEDYYIRMLNEYNLSPQQARQVLPNALKTEIVMTGFMSDWKHFFDLRLLGTTGKPHPDMLQLSTKAVAVLEEAGLWQEILMAR